MIQTPSGSPIDVGMGGALLANMLERWLDGACGVRLYGCAAAPAGP